MKVGDLVKYLNSPVTPVSKKAEEWSLGIVAVEATFKVRVKWLSESRPYWVSQKNLEIINENW